MSKKTTRRRPIRRIINYKKIRKIIKYKFSIKFQLLKCPQIALIRISKKVFFAKESLYQQ